MTMVERSKQDTPYLDELAVAAVAVVIDVALLVYLNRAGTGK